MGIIKAGVKLIARIANDSIAKHQRRNAHKTAYKLTGNQLRQANKRQEYIDGKRAYQRNLAQTKRRIDQDHHNRSKFIDEL